MRLRRLHKRPYKRKTKTLKSVLHQQMSHPPRSRPLPKMRKKTRANLTRRRRTIMMKMKRSHLSLNRLILKRNVPYSKRKKSARRNGFNR